MAGKSLIENSLARDIIAASLRSVADKICRDHFKSITQEPALTARIGQALEDSLRLRVLGYEVQVVTQDIPDRGPGAMERRLGPDLYVGVSVQTHSGAVTKGLIVQAKWAGSLSPRERADLDKKCSDMLRRTRSSYVWVYTAEGVRTLPAEAVMIRQSRKTSGGDRLDELFSDVLACNEGDERIGLPMNGSPRNALGQMLERLAALSGVAVSINDVR